MDKSAVFGRFSTSGACAFRAAPGKAPSTVSMETGEGAWWKIEFNRFNAPLRSPQSLLPQRESACAMAHDAAEAPAFVFNGTIDDSPTSHSKEVIPMNRIKLTALVLVLAAVGLVLVPKDAHAVTAPNVNITVTVKISGSLSVSAAPTSYAFGNIASGIGSISGTSITVTNDSDAFTETYNMSAANSTDGTVTWTLSSAQGTDQYVLAAVFSSARPDGAFVTSASRLTTSSQACTDAAPGVFEGNQTCVSVLKDLTRILWFELVTPNSTGSTTTQTTTVAIRATAG